MFQLIYRLNTRLKNGAPSWVFQSCLFNQPADLGQLVSKRSVRELVQAAL